jgi:mycothiol system anti-sigma-R factor
MGCDDVRRVAYFFLDGALGNSKREDLELHLRECENCDQRVRVHQRIRTFLSARLPRMTAPPSLKERLGTAFESARVSG